MNKKLKQSYMKEYAGYSVAISSSPVELSGLELYQS